MDPDSELRALVHDLRTPLTIVEGFSELLVRRGAELDPGAREEYARRIAAAAAEMRALLDRPVAGPDPGPHDQAPEG
jgi:K+-sensing histidine kinase KdpD